MHHIGHGNIKNMKRLAICMYLLSVSFICLSQFSLKRDTIINRFINGKIKSIEYVDTLHVNGSCIQYKSKYEEYFENEMKKHYIQYNFNEEKDGWELFWYENGQKQKQIRWNNGEREGFSISYYELGGLLSIEEWHNNRLNGSNLTFFQSGDLMIRLPYKNDTLNGIIEGYYSPGVIKTRGKYDNGMGTVYEYYKNGRFKKKTIWAKKGVIKEREYFDTTGYMYYKEELINGEWKVIKHDKSKIEYLQPPPNQE
jgi:antitoxin component YwqK of YwqJK toxin-antitoxin module